MAATPTRNLPARAARSTAIDRINLRTEEADPDNDFPDDIEEDDVVGDFDAEDGGSEYNDLPDDELNIEDLFREDESSVEASDDNDDVNSPELISPSGLRWSSHPLLQGNVGRQPSRNIFTARHGFRSGVHPHSRKEAFLLFMEDVIHIMTIYTNIAGRRLAKEWRRTDDSEIEAFIGLHTLAGKIQRPFCTKFALIIRTRSLNFRGLQSASS